MFALVYGSLQQSYEQKAQAYDRARRAFAEQRNAAVELRNALRLSTAELQVGFEATVALEHHFQRCPLGAMISIQD